MPVRIATPGVAPNKRDSPVITISFSSSGPTARKHQHDRMRQITIGFSSMPMVMKNSPSSTSRNGLMSSST
jgi:hypothetical protein